MRLRRVKLIIATLVLSINLVGCSTIEQRNLTRPIDYDGPAIPYYESVILVPVIEDDAALLPIIEDE